MCTGGLPQLSKAALYINKAWHFSAANITGLNHTLQQLMTQLALYKVRNTRESTQNRDFNCLQVQNNTKTKKLIYHVYSTHKQTT